MVALHGESEVTCDIRVELLGPFRVRVGDADLPITATRERVLLAMLLLHVDQPVPKDALVEAIWGEQRPTRPDNQVQCCVSRLRRRFAGAGVAGEVIVTGSGGYRVPADWVRVDLWEFRSLVARARAIASSEPLSAADHYRSAQALWHGPSLALGNNDWARRVGDTLEAERLCATEERVELDLFLGGAGELVAELTDLVSRHPYREGLHRAMMMALYRAGRRADALGAYRHARELFAAELGLEPGTALRELHRRMLADDATLLSTGSAPAGGPGRALTPRQLPAPPRMFTGRAAELAELDRVPDPSAMVVTAIVGMAGVGKTALALCAAQRLARRYPDGQLFIDLHGYTKGLSPLDPGEALHHTLLTLGVPVGQIPADLDGRAALYRSRLAGRRVLVLLDNAATEAQVMPLLPGAAGCLVLVTSRHRLTGLDDSHTVYLSTVPLADAVSLFTRATGPHRLRHQPPELLAEAIELCGRLPLALCIAAARLRSHPTWSLAYLVDRLSDHRHRLAELETGQRSVTAALDLSYLQLPAPQRRGYRLLGLHPGPDIDAGAAAALCDTTAVEARQLLDRLQEAHLLQESTPGRYQFHDLVRSHAALTARSQPDRRAALTRLFDRYLHTATVARDLVYPNDRGPRPRARAGDTVTGEWADPAGAGRWLDTELPNLLAAAQHAADHGWPDHATGLCAALHRHLFTLARYRDAELLHHRTLEIASATGDRHGELRALTGLGGIRRRQGRHEQAIGYFERAGVIAHATGDRDGQLEALAGLGRCHRLQGRHDEAVAYLTQARDIARTTGNLAGELDALTALGHICRQQGRHGRAIAYLVQARDSARATGDGAGELGTLTGLGLVHLMEGRYADATDHFAQALATARTIGDRTLELGALTGLGHVDRRQGRCEQAVVTYHQALAIAEEIGSRNWQFESVHGLGRAHQVAGRPTAALARHEDALQLATELGQPEDQVRAHNGLGHAYQALDDPDRARTHWRAALEIMTSLGTDHTEDGEATAHSLGAQLAALDRGDPGTPPRRSRHLPTHLPTGRTGHAAIGHAGPGVDLG